MSLSNRVDLPSDQDQLSPFGHFWNRVEKIAPTDLRKTQSKAKKSNRAEVEDIPNPLKPKK